MANIFVWSGAGGLNDGSKWEDAYVNLSSALDGVMAGFTPGTDFVYVRSIHSESVAANIGLDTSNSDPYTGDDPVRVLCVVGAATGTAPGNLATGAQVTAQATYDISFKGNSYIYGINFTVGDDLVMGLNALGNQLIFEQCNYDMSTQANNRVAIKGATDNNDGTLVRWIDCDLDFNAASQYVGFWGNVVFQWWGGSVTGTAVTDFINVSQGAANAEFRGVDLSVLSNNLVDAARLDGADEIIFAGCVLNAGVSHLVNSIDRPDTRVMLAHCQSGVDGDPAYAMAEYTIHGSTEVDTARYRTGGATDGERTNPFSWSMDSTNAQNVIELYEPLVSPPMQTWTDGDAATAVTFTFYVASGATLQNDEFWIELWGPNDASTSSLMVRQSSRCAPRGTPANLTTDAASTWNGADVGTKQQVDITYTPDKPGIVTARAFLAKPTERVSVDPVIYVSGLSVTSNERAVQIPGVGFYYEGDAAGGAASSQLVGGGLIS